MNRIELVENLSLLLDCILALPNFLSKYRLPISNSKRGEINILGTGPSLKESLKSINSQARKVDSFAMNDFAISELFLDAKPTYYILVDEAYWLSETYIQKKDHERRKMVFDNLLSKTDWKLELFIPSNVFKQKTLAFLEENHNIIIRPINLASLSLVDKGLYYKLLSLNIAASFNNVLAVAIYIAINLGYETINIYGAEHSWTKDIRVNDKNQVCTISRHFYEEEEKLVPWMTSDNKNMEMQTILLYLQRHFRAYKLLNKYALMHSVEIINRTPNSFIDAFKREL